MSGTSDNPGPGASNPGPEGAGESTTRWESFTVDCPRGCGTVVVSQVQGDRCPTCNSEFTRFEAGQDLVAQVFYEVLTGYKYVQDLPDGGKVVVHG